MSECMVTIENIDVYYGDVHVIRGISFDVNTGEVVTVIGPNGAGKSTLLTTIMGFRHPRNGSISFNGSRIDRLPPEKIVRLGITFVPEGSRIFQDMSVLDNLKMGSYSKSARGDRKKNLDMVFALFPRLLERSRQKGGTLSGGERQMLAIGRALMSNPTMLLLDEPSLGLQPLLVTRVFETIQEISSMGLTILLVEQNVHFSLEITDRAYVLENGGIVMEGTGQSLMENDHVKNAYLAV